MPEASPKIVELTRERNELIEQNALLEKNKSTWALRINEVSKTLASLSIQEKGNYSQLNLYSNTRSWLLCNLDLFTIPMKTITGKINHLAWRIENLKKMNEGGG
ncbi:MAG TPA: hypothetical protein VI757_16370 [Bacteroidia bacterium]|nr:hypothetical protein [Bacteroidia bacterium]